MAELTVSPAHALRGTLAMPGDKSISHRAFLIAAISHGTTRILRSLHSEDVQRSRAAIESLGVPVEESGEEIRVVGRGLQALRAPRGSLEMGNSGTTTRLLLGILAGCPFRATLSGDASLSLRPMRRVTEPLARMGARIEGLPIPALGRWSSRTRGGQAPAGTPIEGESGSGHLPLTIQGGRLQGIRHVQEVASAQVKSCVLLAGLHAEGPTTVVEPVPTRDHTERMLRYMGARLTVAAHPEQAVRPLRRSSGQASTELRANGASKDAGRAITLSPGARLVGREMTVPGDFSSAAFFLVAAAIVPGSEVTVRRVGLNPTRTGLLGILERMGARVSVIPAKSLPSTRSRAGIKTKADPRLRGDDNKNEVEWEPVGDLTVSYAPLKAVSVGPEEVPNVIDELPAVMVAATQAEGESRLSGVGELRVKETDRIRSMCAGLSAMGARIRAEGDTVVVEGPTRLRGGVRVHSLGDHRTAMALAVAGLAADSATSVEGSEWIRISFPEFEACLASIRRG